MFPEGEYSFQGKTVEGLKLIGTAMLTHNIPAAPGLIFPDPELEENETDPENTVIQWEDTSEIGDPMIVRYHVVVEFEEELTERVFEFSVDVLADPDAPYRSVTVPAEFFESLEDLDGEYKAEVVAIEESRNASISENEFQLEE